MEFSLTANSHSSNARNAPYCLVNFSTERIGFKGIEATIGKERPGKVLAGKDSKGEYSRSASLLSSIKAISFSGSLGRGFQGSRFAFAYDQWDAYRLSREMP